MSPEGRKTAARAFRLAVGGLDATEVARRAEIPDAGTVRTFMAGNSWPNLATREKLETLAGWQLGDLVLYAYGDKKIEGGGDAVIDAIDESELTPRNKRRLKLAYEDMLEAQREEATG